MVRVDKDKLNLAEVSAIGIGGMIGGGIFAVLGLAIATAGHAVALTLAGGGVIALLTGLSYAHLGLHFRGDGGSFTYIEKAFASPLVAGCAGWLLVVGYVGTLALYATHLVIMAQRCSVMAVLGQSRRCWQGWCWLGFSGLTCAAPGHQAASSLAS